MAAPTISAQFLRHVANCLELTGSSAAPLLARFGVDRARLDDPDGLIPLADFLGFFEAAAEYARQPHFGLHAGRLAGSDSLGPLSFLFLSAPDLGTAFASFTRYLATMQQASRNVFRVAGEWARFEYRILDPALGPRRQDAEYSLGAMFSLARQFTGGELELREVRFEHERAGDHARYADYFGCAVFFEQAGNSLSFATRWLDAPGRVLSAALHPIVEDHLRRKGEGGGGGEAGGGGEGGLVRRVRALIADAPPDRPPTMAVAARALGVSVPTLARHLAAAGTGWRALAEAQRMAAAARLLRETRRSVSDIALALGYAEAASFIRAFARAHGQTPARFRARK